MLAKYVVLIMQIINIIRDNFKMEGMKQERPDEGPILNFHEIHFRQSLSKKYGTHVEKSIVFKALKK